MLFKASPERVDPRNYGRIIRTRAEPCIVKNLQGSPILKRHHSFANYYYLRKLRNSFEFHKVASLKALNLEPL